MVSLVLSLSLFAAEVAPPPLDAEQKRLREAAAQLHDAGHPAEAAAQLEALISATGGHPDLHFDAGQSRMAAGHHAHARRHFLAFLAAPGLPADDRELGKVRVEAAESRTEAVTVRLFPGTDALVRVRRADDPSRPALEATAVGGAALMHLDPGPWDVEVEASGFPPRRARVEVAAAPVTLELRLVPETGPAAGPPVAPAPALRPATGRAETIAGGVLVPLGLVALGALAAVAPAYQETRSNFSRLRGALERDPCDAIALVELAGLPAEARRERAALIALGVTSGALLGAGVGLLVHGQRLARRSRPARLSLHLRPGFGALTLLGKF